MANKTIKDVTLLLRNNRAEVWSEKNPTLSKGEIGIESDTRKFKFGDGVTPWIELEYASSTNTLIRDEAPTEFDVDYDLGSIWVDLTDKTQIYILMELGTYAEWVAIPTAKGEPDIAKEAEKLQTARKITLQGAVLDVSQEFDGSGDISFNLVLQNSGVTAGTYTKLTVNQYGIITAAEKLSASDIPDLTSDQISDAGTAITKNVGTGAGEVPLIGEDGKIDSDLIPSISITDVFVVDSEAEMLALDAERGDVAVRTDVNNTFILKGDDPAVLSNWVELLHPECDVTSVNGKTGAVVLTTDDVSEGTEHEYYTETRATANFNSNIKGVNAADLADGDTIVFTTDELIIDCGNDED